MESIEKINKKALHGKREIYFVFGLLLICFFVIIMLDLKKKEEENNIVSVYVKEDADNIFTSKDNGVSWLDENIPEYFMTMENKEIRMDEGNVLIMLQNNGDDILIYGQEFRLFRWNKDMWIPCSMIDNFYFTQMAYLLYPGCSCQMQCNLQCYEYKRGKYLLTKNITKKDTDKKVELGIEFVIK